LRQNPKKVWIQKKRKKEKGKIKDPDSNLEERSKAPFKDVSEIDPIKNGLKINDGMAENFADKTLIDDGNDEFFASLDLADEEKCPMQLRIDLHSIQKLMGEHKEDKKAPIYVKAMQKVMEKGAGYIQTESERVKKIMAGKLTPEKKEELSDKLKILTVFATTD